MNDKIKSSLITFFNKYPLVKYKKGDIILQPGDKFPGIIFVKSGYIRVYNVTSDGKEVTLQLFKPLFYFSMIDATTNIGSRHFFEAMTNVEMWIAPRDEAIKFFNDNKEISEDIMKTILMKFIDLTTNIEQLISGDAYKKVAGLVYALADEFGDNKDGMRMIKFKLTHKLIASLTGLTRETVTLQMLKLEREDYLDNKRRQIFVKDMEKLERLARL